MIINNTKIINTTICVRDDLAGRQGVGHALRAHGETFAASVI